MAAHGLTKSFADAARGVVAALRSERNLRIDALAFLAVVGVGIALDLRSWEWALLLLVAAFVIVVELVNSAVERLLDLLKPRLHVYARDVKDMMAGATLIAALTALAVGLLIVVPRVAALLERP